MLDDDTECARLFSWGLLLLRHMHTSRGPEETAHTHFFSNDTKPEAHKHEACDCGTNMAKTRTAALDSLRRLDWSRIAPTPRESKKG